MTTLMPPSKIDESCKEEGTIFTTLFILLFNDCSILFVSSGKKIVKELLIITISGL